MALREQVRRRFGLQAEASHIATASCSRSRRARCHRAGPRLSWDGYPGPRPPREKGIA
jgi:hypothetical protein